MRVSTSRTARRVGGRSLVDDDTHAEVLEDLHAGAERLLEHRRRDDVARGAIGDDRVVHAHQVREVSGHAVEIVSREDDRDSVLVQVSKQVQHVMAGGHVDPTRGLVHQQELRLTQQGPSEEHPLLLPTGQLTNVPLRQPSDAQALEHSVDIRLLLAACPRHATSTGPRHQDAFHDGDGEVPVHRLELGHVGHAEAVAPPDRASHRWQGAEEEAKQRGLPCPRRADDPGELVLVDMEARRRAGRCCARSWQPRRPSG